MAHLDPPQKTYCPEEDSIKLAYKVESKAKWRRHEFVFRFHRLSEGIMVSFAWCW